MQIELMELGSVMLKNIPDILVWLFGIVMASIMVRRGGGKLEKMFLIGCCLMFVMQFFNPFINLIFRWARESGDMSNISYNTYGLVHAIFSAVLSIPAIILLVWAFWKKFRRPKEGAV